jgi:Fe-S oxidoreductase
MLHRKRAALGEVLGAGGAGKAMVLTNCPSCVQGLGRNAALGVRPKHLTVALAERLSGPAWMEKFRRRAASAHAVQF